MIVRRQLYSQNKLHVKQGPDSGMECKPIYNKKEPEHKSVSSGTTIVRDVEDLLKPIQRMKQSDDSNAQLLKERTERNLWRNHEVMEMLLTMQQTKALEKLNDKTVKSENVFKDVETIMHRNGYVKKSHVQIWTKWKFLKSTYMTSRRNGVIPRMVPPQIYEMIHQMITGLNQSLADSCSSADGDSSSVSGMIISGVEGGVSEAAVSNEENEDSFGMAHPIFGFRLGMVKSEPEDTGYEPANNNGSVKDPLEKDTSPSKSDKEVKIENNNTVTKISKEPEPVQKVLEIPHRGRGRPPKYPPAHTSVSSNTSSPATKPLPLPPLRVAPFARTILQNVTVDRPPPPLTMPPASRIQSVNYSSLKNGTTSKYAQPKLTPKPTHQQHSPPPVQSARFTKDQTVSTRTTSTPSPSYPKMKQIPMRKTPYSLRPDRAIPDLEASLSPPPPPLAIEKPHKKFEDVPTTKHLIMQSNSINSPSTAHRKRRTDWQETPVTKQPRYNNNNINFMDEGLKHSTPENNDYGKNYGKVLQSVIIDLSTSLRKMQTEMMRDFFNKQNELLEKEHKFQMQQDQMIMKAFKEQTQDIMNSVKQLVGSIKTHKAYQHNGTKENIRKEGRRNARRHVRMQHMRQQQQHGIDLENDQMENNGEQSENEDEDDEQEHGQEDNEMEQDTIDMYTDGEEQQDPIDGHDENRTEEMENISDEEEHEDNEHHEVENETQSTTDEPNENGLITESDNQNPIIHLGESSDINEDK